MVSVELPLEYKHEANYTSYHQKDKQHNKWGEITTFLLMMFIGAHRPTQTQTVSSQQ